MSEKLNELISKSDCKIVTYVLAYIKDDDILDYLEDNLLSVCNVFELYIIYRNPHSLNPIDIAISQKNVRFLSILTKHFQDKKPKIWECIRKVLDFIYLIAEDPYLSEEYKSNIITAFKCNYIDYNRLDIDTYLKYIPDEENFGIPRLILLLIYNNTYVENLVDKYPIKYVEKNIISQLVNSLRPDREINIKNFTQILSFILKKYPKYNYPSNSIDDIIGLVDKCPNYNVYVLKLILNFVIPCKSISEYSLNLMYKGVSYGTVFKLLGYNIYERLHLNVFYDLSFVIIKDLLYHNFRRIRECTPYDIRHSYLLKKGNLITYTDKYVSNKSYLLKQCNITPEIKIDLITTAVLVGDIEVIRYLMNLYNKNFDISEKVFSMKCNCNALSYTETILSVHKHLHQEESSSILYQSNENKSYYKIYNKSSYTIRGNPFVKGSSESDYLLSCECSKTLKVNKININNTLPKIEDLIKELMNDNINIIKYN